MPALVESMMYVREKPWHGLGTRVEEAPTSTDALRMAGLDWSVVQRNIQVCGGAKIKNYKANIRDSDGRCWALSLTAIKSCRTPRHSSLPIP